MEYENGQLSKVIRRLNFGQFLFLYFVAKNTSFSFVQELLHKLKIRGAPNWGKGKKLSRNHPETKTEEHEENESLSRVSDVAQNSVVKSSIANKAPTFKNRHQTNPNKIVLETILENSP